MHLRPTLIVLVCAGSACMGELGARGEVIAPGPREEPTGPTEEPPDPPMEPVDPPEEPPPDPEPPARPELDPLGPMVEVLTPVGSTLTFTVPEGSLGFQLAGSDLYVDSLLDPSGTARYRDGVPVGWPAGLYGPSVTQVFMNEETVAMGVPPGTWTATLAYPSSAPVRLIAQRSSDGAFHGGVLDLYLYVPRSGVTDPERSVTVTPENVLDDYAEGIDEFYAELQRLIGIERGEVRAIAVDDRFADVRSEAASIAAFGASPAGMGPGFHALLTFGGYEAGWAGVAPGAPSAQVAGEPNATVLLDVRTHGYFGYTALHELGHVTGLYHPTDLGMDGGFLHDALDDTLACTRTQTVMGYTYPGCSEDSNLMASYGETRPTTLSATQREVFRSAAVYRPYSPGAASTYALRAARTPMRAPPPEFRQFFTRCAR